MRLVWWMPEPASVACHLAELNPRQSFDTDLNRQRLHVQNVQYQTTLDLLYDLIDLWKRYYSYTGLGY